MSTASMVVSINVERRIRRCTSSAIAKSILSGSSTTTSSIGSPLEKKKSLAGEHLKNRKTASSSRNMIIPKQPRLTLFLSLRFFFFLCTQQTGYAHLARAASSMLLRLLSLITAIAFSLSSVRKMRTPLPLNRKEYI